MRFTQLAFDGSPKAKEALFVAAYVAERWHTKLTVLTLRDKSRATPAALDYARDYLDIHELSSLSENCHCPAGESVIHWSHDQKIQDRLLMIV
jgi:hypothetical protein